MNFFDRQEASHRATRYLILLFGAAFLTVGLATGIVVLLALGFAGNGAPGALAAPDLGTLLLDSADVLAAIAAVVVGVMLVASLFRVATLTQGGGHVARMLGGTQIRPDDADPSHRRLLNVVEEMAIASGLPVPEVYVLEAERGINAFAAGLTPADAAVAVTRGSLEQLDRNELQGVIAHEFSHILNGDMRLNLRLMGFSFGILVLFLVGRWLLRASSRGVHLRSRKGSPAIMIGLGLTVIGAIGVVLSRLIKAAVSRQREVLADASAVQFTREPLALAGALRKIGGFTPYLETVETEEISHMLFGSAGRSFAGWFATHPPLKERIQALDPSFVAGDYIEPRRPGQAIADDTLGDSGISRISSAAASIDVDSVGRIDPAAGIALHGALPFEIVDAAHSSQASWLLVLALGLERGGGSTAERRLIASQLGAELSEKCIDLRYRIDELDPGLLLPLFELTLPALRTRPQEHLDYLFDLLGKLVAADGEITLFEYLLQRMLRLQFKPTTRMRSSAAERFSATCTVLATLAVCGHEDADSASRAFAAGLATLAANIPVDIERALAGARADIEHRELDQALDVLASARASQRQQILTALATTMRYDERIGVHEAELFRTVAAVLDCPVPPTHVIG